MDVNIRCTVCCVNMNFNAQSNSVDIICNILSKNVLIIIVKPANRLDRQIGK